MKQRRSKIPRIEAALRRSRISILMAPTVTRKRRRRAAAATTTATQEPSPPAAMPEDLMIEILSRVPASDPLQLRCVCKWWKALVSDPQFVKNYLHRSITEINDLASKALEDMVAFELQLNYAPAAAAAAEDDNDDAEEADEEDADAAAAAEEEARAWRKELDIMLTVVRSLKEGLETIKVDVKEITDRMKCLQSFLQIYLKTVM